MESVASHLGLPPTTRCADMTREDWSRFLLASVGAAQAKELQVVLANEELADAVLSPLKADCMAYESYRLEKAERLQAAIFTLRGDGDHVTTLDVMKTWTDVAGGRLEHREFKNSGHMLARDVPLQLARHLATVSLPEFTDSLGPLVAYRKAYHMRGKLSKNPTFPKILGSPVLGYNRLVTSIEEPQPLDLDSQGYKSITPQSQKIKIMRSSNKEWRSRAYGGCKITGE